jgi:hypothetical protein
MAKFHGVIGYVVTEETTPGVWEKKVIERSYYGDLLANNRKFQTTEQVNDDINISNKISILADSFAYENSHVMKYVVLMGTKWKIKEIDIQYPRLILSVGGVYNG